MKYLLLYLPFVFAYLLQDFPVASYSVAWTGSFFILWITLTGRIKPLPGGTRARAQLFRPIVFTQIVFAGYTALTSIFYFAAVARGTLRVAVVGTVMPSLQLSAVAQSYYVLAHAAVVTGMLISMNYHDSGLYRIRLRIAPSRLLVAVAATFFLLAQGSSLFPALSQLSVRLREFATAASVFSFAFSVIRRDGILVWLNGGIFAANMFSALLSGWKEEVLVLLLLFFIILYPYHRRLISIVGVISVVGFVLVMPAYTVIYRKMAWYGNVGPQEAMEAAVREVFSGRVSLTGTTQAFATGRLSEIGLFIGYLREVPDHHPFYGTSIIQQAALNLIPRAAWPDKPNTEAAVMERVYENSIFSRASLVSAKPQYVVDAYLTAGVVGIVVAGIIYGILATTMSRLAERWFGGYLLGSGLVYGALFQIFWRGNAFEFFFGTVMWSFLVMFAIFQVGRTFHVIVPGPRRWPHPLGWERNLHSASGIRATNPVRTLPRRG